MPRSSYHHGNLRQALIDAVIQASGDQGVDAIRVSALARSLGVSSAAPFRHFADRQELLVASAEHAADDLMVEVQRAGDERLDPGELELERAVAYVRFAATHPGHFALLSRSDLLAASPKLQAMTSGYQANLEPLFKSGSTGQSAPELLARSAGVLAAQAMAYGLAHLAVDGLLGDRSPEEIALLAREALRTLGRGGGQGAAQTRAEPSRGTR